MFFVSVEYSNDNPYPEASTPRGAISTCTRTHTYVKIFPYSSQQTLHKLKSMFTDHTCSFSPGSDWMQPTLWREFSRKPWWQEIGGKPAIARHFLTAVTGPHDQLLPGDQPEVKHRNDRREKKTSEHVGRPVTCQVLHEVVEKAATSEAALWLAGWAPELPEVS